MVNESLHRSVLPRVEETCGLRAARRKPLTFETNEQLRAAHPLSSLALASHPANKRKPKRACARLPAGEDFPKTTQARPKFAGREIESLTELRFAQPRPGRDLLSADDIPVDV